jgi:hypothetical protein
MFDSRVRTPSDGVNRKAAWEAAFALGRTSPALPAVLAASRSALERT